MIGSRDLHTVIYKFIGQMSDLHIRVILRSSMYASTHVTTGMNHDMIWLTSELVLRTERSAHGPTAEPFFHFNFILFFIIKKGMKRENSWLEPNV